MKRKHRRLLVRRAGLIRKVKAIRGMLKELASFPSFTMNELFRCEKEIGEIEKKLRLDGLSEHIRKKGEDSE